MADHPPPSAPGALAVGLGFVAGFVDTFGFVALFFLFTAHVTGNLVLIGAAVVKSGPGILAKLLALPVFVVTVIGVWLFVRAHERVGRPVLTSLLVLQIVLLGGFMAAGLALEPFTEADDTGAVVTGLIGVAAMAVQNAGWRLAFPSLVPTTVMTGNITQVVIDAVDALWAQSPAARAEARGRLKRFIPAILSFTAGAIVGAVAFAQAGYRGLLLPLVVLATLIIVERPIHKPHAK